MSERGDNPLSTFLVAASSARRAQLAALIPAGKTVTASGISVERILQAAPDVVIVDASIETTADAVIDLAEELSGTGVVVLIDHPSSPWTARALDAGVHAILSRAATAEELHLAMAAATSGLVLLHPTYAASLIRQTLGRATNSLIPGEELTARERQILRLLSEGLGNKEIAGRLSISDHTVKFHISSILGKLNVASRTEAVSQGIRRGLIPI